LLTAHERAIGADADRFRVLLKGCDILVGQWVKLPLELIARQRLFKLIRTGIDIFRSRIWPRSSRGTASR
jgi:hypothetical protein